MHGADKSSIAQLSSADEELSSFSLQLKEDCRTFHKERKKDIGGQPWLHLQHLEASREQN